MFLTGCIISCLAQALIFKTTYLFITKSTVDEGKFPYRRLDHILRQDATCSRRVACICAQDALSAVWLHHKSFHSFDLLGYAADKMYTCIISIPRILTIRLHFAVNVLLSVTAAAKHIATVPSSLAK